MSPPTRDFRTRASSVYSRSSVSTSCVNAVSADGVMSFASEETVGDGSDQETMLPEGKMKMSPVVEGSIGSGSCR